MQTKFEVLPARVVEKELEEVFRWIAKDSYSAAVDWYNGCIDAMYSLDVFPQRCALAPESENFGIEIRNLHYGNYRILFTISESTVYVLHVRHGAREHLRPDNSQAN